ncbi:MAG: hypothetical protein ACI4TI_02540 [Christensenellales bacterium]
MKKLWAKIIKNYKIINSFTLGLDEDFDFENFFEQLREICYNLKIETPIILQKHIHQLNEFGTTKFTKSDFVDDIDFDSLVLEYFEQS